MEKIKRKKRLVILSSVFNIYPTHHQTGLDTRLFYSVWVCRCGCMGEARAVTKYT